MAEQSRWKVRADRRHAEGKCVTCGGAKGDPLLRLCRKCQNRHTNDQRRRRNRGKVEQGSVGVPIRDWYEAHTIDLPPGAPEWGMEGFEGFRDPADPNRGADMRKYIPRNLQEWEDRRMNGPRPPTWRSYVGPAPVLTRGSKAVAKLYLWRLYRALDTHCELRNDGIFWVMSDHEMNMLYAEIRKWRTRAAGDDIRFNLFGNAQRGLTREQSILLKNMKERYGKSHPNRAKEAAGSADSRRVHLSGEGFQGEVMAATDHDPTRPEGRDGGLLPV